LLGDLSLAAIHRNNDFIMSQSDNGQTAFNYFVNLGLSPVQASGIVGNLMGESGQGLNPSATNRGDGRDGSDSIGIGQWNGPRAAALKAYADSKGTPWTDLNTQLEFLHSELKGPESKAYGALQAAQTPEEAGRAFMAYERPKDWNVPGSHPERAQYALNAYNTYGTPQQASAQPAPMNPAAPPSAPQAMPPQQAPIFAQQPQAPQQAAPQPSPFGMAAMPQAQPIFAPQRKPIDLSKLQAALAAAQQRGPIFG
jgi:hypothetical protein